MSRPPSHNAAGGIKSVKNRNDSIGIQPYDFPACRAVPQPRTPPQDFRLSRPDESNGQILTDVILQ